MGNPPNSSTKKMPSINKIRTYFYISLFFINIIILFYSYLFVKDNIYYSINFNESNFPQNLRKLGNVDIQKFDEVVNKIDKKKISKTLKINDFLNN